MVHCDICREYRRLLRGLSDGGSARVIIREWKRHYQAHECLTWPMVVPVVTRAVLN